MSKFVIGDNTNILKEDGELTIGENVPSTIMNHGIDKSIGGTQSNCKAVLVKSRPMLLMSDVSNLAHGSYRQMILVSGSSQTAVPSHDVARNKAFILGA